VAETVERFGGLDVLVANAGGPPRGRALEVDDDAIRHAVEANFLSSVRLAREAVPRMRERGGGRVCLITSYFIKQPAPDLVLSNTARTALWAWAKTAAQDLAADGITVNVLAPGPHATDRMKELGGGGPMGDPEDFGRIVAFLCSRHTGFVSGTALQVDGAATLGLL
jgi:3-oxoacyl-[acyl-carrier protein] reductase